MPELLITPGKGQLGNTHLEDTPLLLKPSSDIIAQQRERKTFMQPFNIIAKIGK